MPNTIDRNSSTHHAEAAEAIQAEIKAAKAENNEEPKQEMSAEALKIKHMQLQNLMHTGSPSQCER